MGHTIFYHETYVFYLILKYFHIIGAIVILGTGTGIAFFMLSAHRSKNVAFIARTSGTVVLADMLFTATAIVAQPITGYLLLLETDTPLSEPWVLQALILFGIAGAFWLPVVWMQTRMRDLAAAAVAANTPLPSSYHRLFRLWFAFGIPGFGSVILILWLMVSKQSW